MPLTDDKLRYLLSLREGERLDFKQAPGYDLASKPGQGDFVKDVVAMANLLGPSDLPAHILLGVDEDPETRCGVAKGFDPWPRYNDDAKLQSILRDRLNRVPKFHFSMHDLDGVRIGAIEILPGQRPYFAVTGRHGLTKHVAWLRRGSSCDSATPQEIWDWALHDARLSLDREHIRLARARETPRANIRGSNQAEGKNWGNGRTGLTWKREVVNVGRCAFRISAVRGVARDAAGREQELEGRFDANQLIESGKSGRLSIILYHEPQGRQRQPAFKPVSGEFTVQLESDVGSEYGASVVGEIQM